LAELTNLIGLSLWNSQVSDISALAGLINLATLRLGNNQQISDEQIAELIEALPDTEILAD